MSDEQPELLVSKESATYPMSSVLLEDYADMGDLIGKALRGEIELKPLPEPEPHRCLFCWLVSLLPGHDRCDHGRLTCDDCADRWADG